MQWSSEEHEALLLFLGNVTSNDPVVQRENIKQLHRLSQWGAAPYAVLDVVCHSHYDPATRQAAVLILKQLLQTNPVFMQALDMGAVAPSLLCALADPLPTVRVGASLVVSSIVSGDGLMQKWPTLLQTLHEKSRELLLQCQRESDTDGVASIALSLDGIARCVRILCEECSSTLRKLVVVNEEACSCLSGVLTHLVHASTLLLQSTSPATSAVASVLEGVACSFTEEVLSPDECSTDEVSEVDAVAAGELDVCPPHHDFRSHVASVHEACCALIVRLDNRSVDSCVLLSAVMRYMNAVLQWDAFGGAATERAAAAALPCVLRCMDAGDEQHITLSLDFITTLAQHTAGGSKVLSGSAAEVSATILRCSVLPPSSLLGESNMEHTAHVPDDSAAVRGHVHNQRVASALSDDGDDNDNVDDDDDEYGSSEVGDASETATTLRQALTSLLDVMSCTCREDLLVHFVPLLASVLSPAPHARAESPQMVEAALFLFTEVVEELFDDLDTSLVWSVAQSCWAVLSAASSSPYYLRYQAVRCVARILGGCMAAGARPLAATAEAITAPCILQLLVDVVVNDANKKVQVEAINSISVVVLATLEECRRSGSVKDSVCISSTFQQLLAVFPSLQLGARTMMYRSISRVFPLALDQPPLLDDATVLRAMVVLVAHGQQLGSGFLAGALCSAGFCDAVELVSLLNALVDVVVCTNGTLVSQTLSSLVALAAVLLESCCNGVPASSPLSVYGSDVVTLLFDMLDGCCDAVLSERDALCHTEAAVRGRALLRELLLGDTCRPHHAVVVRLCLQLMEQQPVEVELRRSCLAFLCGVGRFCDDAVTWWRVYRVCMHEATRAPAAEKALSNAFLCLAQTFYRLAFGEATGEAVTVFRDSVSAQELSALVDTLRQTLAATHTRGCTHVMTNAFSCALALAALHPGAFAPCDTEQALLCYLFENAPRFLKRMEGDVGDQFRALMTLALLMSKLQQQQQPQMLPSVVEVCKAVRAFTTSAPAVLAADVQQKWGPWMDLHSC